MDTSHDDSRAHEQRDEGVLRSGEALFLSQERTAHTADADQAHGHGAKRGADSSACATDTAIAEGLKLLSEKLSGWLQQFSAILLSASRKTPCKAISLDWFWVNRIQLQLSQMLCIFLLPEDQPVKRRNRGCCTSGKYPAPDQ